MRKSKYEAPLTEEEQSFAAENHHLIKKYLNMRKLPFDEWYDVVIFRYLLSVKRWFAIPELHKHSFEIIVFYAMRSAIGNEWKKEKRRIPTISLDEVIPGTDGVTLADTVTYGNLNYIDYKGGDDVEIKYDVQLPVKNSFRGGAKSDEILAIETFLKMKGKKNMCFEYESDEEAKKRLSSVQAYRRRESQKEIYDAYRVEKCVYIVRMEDQKKGKGKQDG